MEGPAAAEVYDTNRFSQLYHASRRPSPEHLGLAADFLFSLFDRHSILFAFLGGWAVYLRGGSRRTEDVDVSVDTDMDGLTAILMPEERICVPKTHGNTCIQVFVHTGGRWDDEFSSIPELPVSVDIIICGNLGIPPNLSEATEMITPTVSVDLGLHTGQAVPVIDLYHQFSTKLHVHYERRNNGQTDDYVDLEFLAENYSPEIWRLHPYLNRDHRLAFWQDFAIRHQDEYDRVEHMEMILGLSS